MADERPPSQLPPDDTPPQARGETEPIQTPEDVLNADVTYPDASPEPSVSADAHREAEGAAPSVEASAPRALDMHELPTMPIPLEPGATDPKKTLPGSGGLDPNPDMMSNDSAKRSTRRDDSPYDPPLPRDPVQGGQTVPHIVPFQHTMVHVPGEQRAQKAAPQRPVQNAPAPGQNAPRPVVQAPPYQGQAAYSQPPQQQNYPPPQPNYPPGYQQPNYGGAYPGVPNQRPLPRRPRPARRGFLGCTPGCLAVFVGLFATFCGGLTLITLVLTATLGAELENRVQAQLAGIEDYANFASTFYYDRDGALLFESFEEGRRINVPYEQFPQDLINATLAIEDDSFWTNPGFEIQATTRAFLQYVGLGGQSTGGSTITQQLVRNVLFDAEYRSERSIQRKVEEILLAFLLSQRQSKEQTLAMYLNEIYYGNLAYGAQAAAQTFFNKDVGQLTLGEAALLAGLPQAPAFLDPLNPDPEVQAEVDARWRLVLQRMVDEQFITSEQRDAALSQGLVLDPPEISLRAPHFTIYAQNELETLMVELGYSPEDVARGGLRIYTTVDLDLNGQVQAVMQQQVSSLAAFNATNAAVVVLQPTTGEILSMVGSVDYYNDNIDGRVNVAISPRQPGSTMKPFTYAAAIELGLTPGDILWDTAVEFPDYVPVNYDREFHGPMRMRAALGNSYNIPAVQTLRYIGVENLLAFMQRFGVQSLGTDASQYGLSLTLGGGDMTLLELTRGYTVFANGGSLVPSTAIRCILDRDDNVLYEYEGGCPRGNYTDQTSAREGYGRQVLDPRIAFIMTDILSDNAARATEFGSDSPLHTPGIYTSAKTGTTDDYRDNWTVGYNRNLAVGVWVGNSSGDPMARNTTGVTGAAPIWNTVINMIYADPALLNSLAVDGALSPDNPDQPGGISMRDLCNIGSLREPTTNDCQRGAREWMLDGPAAIPDPEGNLVYPDFQPTPDAPPASGPWLQQIDPGVYRVLVQPLPPDVAAAIVFASSPGAVQPPPPLYCQVPIEAAGTAAGASERVFIAPPPYPDDAARAEQYARAQGFAFLPTIACSSELLTMGGAGAPVVTAFISQPAPGQTVGPDGIPILGTANFTPQQAQFYKLEVCGGQFGSGCATLSDVSYSPVINGQLGFLPGQPGLAPGGYTLQLVVVGLDGNYVQAPYQVPFTVQ